MFDKNGIKTIVIQECTGFDSLQVPIIQRYTRQYKHLKDIKCTGRIQQFLVQQVADLQSNVLQTEQLGNQKNDTFTLTIINKFIQIDADFERKNLKMLRAALFQKCISSNYLLKTHYVCDEETEIILIQDPISKTLANYHKDNPVYIQNEKNLTKVEKIVDQLSRAIKFFHQNKIHHIQLSPESVGYEEQDDGGVRIYLINFEVERVIVKLDRQNKVIESAFNRPRLKDYPETQDSRRNQKLISRLQADLIVSNNETNTLQKQKRIEEQFYRDLWGIGAMAHFLLFQSNQTQYYLGKYDTIERYLESNMKFYLENVKSQYLKNVINQTLIQNYNERVIVTLDDANVGKDDVWQVNQFDLAYIRHVHKKILIFSGKTKISSNVQLYEMQVV